MHARLISAIIVAILAAGCGSDATASDGVADELLPAGEALASRVLASNRADVELTATATPIVDGTADIGLQFGVLDKGSVLDPTVTIDLEPGVTLPSPPEGCESVDQQTVCTLIRFFDALRNEALELTLPVQVDVGTTDPTITLTATSYANPVDNDPDPINNLVELTHHHHPHRSCGADHDGDLPRRRRRSIRHQHTELRLLTVAAPRSTRVSTPGQAP